MFRFYEIQYSKRDVSDDEWLQFTTTMCSDKTGKELYDEIMDFIKSDLLTQPNIHYPLLFIRWFKHKMVTIDDVEFRIDNIINFGEQK